MSPLIPGPLPGRRTVNTIKDRGATYEQRLVTCGKPNCTRCNGDRAKIKGHGPYWYLCYVQKGRWVRLYLGKNLDTNRFRLPDGELNWAEIHDHRNRRRAAAKLAKTP